MKLRVVFNNSNPTTLGYLLNDLLHNREKLQTDLFDVLIWLRLFRYSTGWTVLHWCWENVLTNKSSSKPLGISAHFWMDPDKGLLIDEFTIQKSSEL